MQLLMYTIYCYLDIIIIITPLQVDNIESRDPNTNSPLLRYPNLENGMMRDGHIQTFHHHPIIRSLREYQTKGYYAKLLIFIHFIR